ncbi:MAG: hypothetical protein GY749_27385 [Desulfobacteraceae bacterium]|nr:hypothetical protein [Desulfobacteraceae bacterium]
MLKPIDADFLQEKETHYIIMSGNDLLAELQAIEQATASINRTPAARPSEDDCMTMAAVFSELLLPSPSVPQESELFHALSRLQCSQTGILLYVCRRAIREIQYIQKLEGRDFEPTDSFLVSPIWKRRINDILSGALYPAYVACYRFF